jgi:hypothetical protein
LEAHPLPPSIEDLLFPGVWFLGPIAFLVGIVVFLILWLMKKIKLAEESLEFLYSVVGWGFGGLGIASAIVIAESAYYSSPQGPFSIIFLDGPLGAGVGTVVGLVFWLSDNADNIGWKIVGK